MLFSAALPQVEQAIYEFMQQEDVPGLAVAIYSGGKGTIRCYGEADLSTGRPVTADTLFEIASITKVFTSTDLALQVEWGKMQLQDHLERYMPRLQGASGEITLEELATHTSSLPRDVPAEVHDRQMLIAYLQTWEAPYPIGSRYVYSNLAFGLLGFALENVERRPYEEILQKEILRPLGMSSTVVTVPERLKALLAVGYSVEGKSMAPRGPMIIPASGALRSTATDMLQFLKANLGLIGSPDLIEACQIAQDGYFRVSDKLTLGLGWQRVKLNGYLVLDKNGGLPGFSSYIGLLPKGKIGVVILANKARVKETLLGRKLLKILKSR